jgi:hypothetical protein
MLFQGIDHAVKFSPSIVCSSNFAIFFAGRPDRPLGVKFAGQITGENDRKTRGKTGGKQEDKRRASGLIETISFPQMRNERVRGTQHFQWEREG